MDASGDSGFKWILARLGDDVRTKYCSQALHEELTDVQTQLSTCCEAMAHAEEVGTAIASLEAAQSASIRPQSVVALLSELHALQRSCQRQMVGLLQPFTDTPATASATAKKEKSKPTAAAVEDKKDEEEDKYVDQRKLLSKVQSIVSKRRRDSWLSDAVDVLHEFVKNAVAEEADDHEELSKFAKKARKDWKKFNIRALGALRTAVLEEAGEQEGQPPRFLKALKKLAKRKGDLASFYKESEELVTAKEKEIAAKKAKKKSEKDAKKKRKLSDASTTSSVAVSAPGVKKATPVATQKPEKKLAIGEARVLLTRCAKEIKLLRDKFTNELFDQNLSYLVDVAFSLSSEFMYDDVSSLVSSLFAVVEHVEKVKQPVKRKNRLMRLEAVLQVLVDTTSISISNRRRETAQEYLSNCQKSLKQIQTHPDESSAVKETHVPENTVSKAKKPHAVVAQQAKRAKHESSTPAITNTYQKNFHPAAAQVQSQKKKKKMLAMGGHVRF